MKAKFFKEILPILSSTDVSSELLFLHKILARLDGLANVDMKRSRDWKAACRTYGGRKLGEDPESILSEELQFPLNHFLLFTFKLFNLGLNIKTVRM